MEEIRPTVEDLAERLDNSLGDLRMVLSAFVLNWVTAKVCRTAEATLKAQTLALGSLDKLDESTVAVYVQIDALRRRFLDVMIERKGQ